MSDQVEVVRPQGRLDGTNSPAFEKHVVLLELERRVGDEGVPVPVADPASPPLDEVHRAV